MLYYVYIALPAGLTSRVAAIATRYQSTARSDPHITLVIPRKIAHRKREHELVRALREAAGTLAPHRITYQGVAYFGRKDFIYVPVRRTRELTLCHEACIRAVRGILEPSRPERFRRPHITLAGRFSPEDGDKAWRMLRHKNFDGQFLCREILLWRMDTADTQWQLVSRCRLGG